MTAATSPAVAAAAKAAVVDPTAYKICVLGSTGHLGTAVVEAALLTGRHAVVAVVRRKRRPQQKHRHEKEKKKKSHSFVGNGDDGISRLEDLKLVVDDDSRFQIVSMDGGGDGDGGDATTATTTEDLARSVFAANPRAFRDCTHVVLCLAARVESVEDFCDFEAVDRDANAAFGLAALRYLPALRHVVLVSTFEGRDSRRVTEFSNAKEDAVDALSDGCRRCARRKVAFSVIRPTAYFKDLTDRAFESVYRNNVHTVLGSGECRINPVAKEDVAQFIVHKVVGNKSEEDGDEREYPVGGPDTFTFRGIGELAAQVIREERNKNSRSRETGDDGGDLQEELQIRRVPLRNLQASAAAMRCCSCCSSCYCCCRCRSSKARAARRRNEAALLNWMVYVSTHDAVAPCVDLPSLNAKHHRLVDHFKALLREYDAAVAADDDENLSREKKHHQE